ATDVSPRRPCGQRVHFGRVPAPEVGVWAIGWAGAGPRTQLHVRASESLMEIDGSVCIITGASSGIGAATARMLSGLGAQVVLAARRTERLQALAVELPGSLAVTTDVTIPGQLERLITQTVDTYGRVDVLLNNAGQGLHVPLEELNPA